MVFGLNAASADGSRSAGRNAAYSGGVAAGSTLLNELFDVESKRQLRKACADLTSQAIACQAATRAWEYQANSEAFRASFLAEHHAPTIDAIKALHRRCTE